MMIEVNKKQQEIESERVELLCSGVMGCLRLIVVWFTLMAVLLVAAVNSSEDGKLSSRECEDLGFTGLALCSDCRALLEYVKDEELVEECYQCCTEDSDDSAGKITYSGAVLEVCMRKLVFYPEIIGFVEEEKDKFPHLKVKYVLNSPPKLVLLDNEGKDLDAIRIDNWKREHMIQFLREKVKPVQDA